MELRLSHTIIMISHQIHMLPQTLQPHAKALPTNQLIVHFMSSTTHNSLIPQHLNIHDIILYALKGKSVKHITNSTIIVFPV